jgi:hypothetical protein
MCRVVSAAADSGLLCAARTDDAIQRRQSTGSTILNLFVDLTNGLDLVDRVALHREVRASGQNRGPSSRSRRSRQVRRLALALL